MIDIIFDSFPVDIRKIFYLLSIIDVKNSTSAVTVSSNLEPYASK